MSNRTILVLEILWIAVGILSVAAGIRFAIIEGGPKIFIFFSMALISFIFALIRHRQRKKR